jgi:hypothetical protein
MVPLHTTHYFNLFKIPLTLSPYVRVVFSRERGAGSDKYDKPAVWYRRQGQCTAVYLNY